MRGKFCWFWLAIIIGMFSYCRPVQAAEFEAPRPDRSRYVYDPSHLLSNGQVEEINRLNVELRPHHANTDSPPTMYVFVFEHRPTKEYKFRNGSWWRDDNQMIAEALRRELNDRYIDRPNVIAINRATGQTSFAPADGDITDFPMTWWTKRWLHWEFYSHIRGLQAHATLKYTQRNVKLIMKAADRGSYWYASVLGGFWSIVGFWLFLKGVAKLFGGGSGGGSSDGSGYVDGYEDGYYDHMIDAQIWDHWDHRDDQN